MSSKSAETALQYWSTQGPIQVTPDQGLINATFLVGSPVASVLQWVNPMFDESIHVDIQNLTRRLCSKGLLTPELIPTRDGKLVVAAETGPNDIQGGCWRMLSFVPGTTVHQVQSHHMAHQAGQLVGRFHSALANWKEQPVAPRRNAHDTPARMTELEKALSNADNHPLGDISKELGEKILQKWSKWNGELDEPERWCHGDLKLSNLRFDREAKQAICLLDFDTIGMLPISLEMGDAWRSWCNPAGEDEPDRAYFDIDIFTQSAKGFFSTGPTLTMQEQTNLAPAIERICLELAARFCADSINNCYFRENRTRWPQPGKHNWTRAAAQLNLACSVRNQQNQLETVIRNCIGG